MALLTALDGLLRVLAAAAIALLIAGTALAADSPTSSPPERYGAWEVACGRAGESTSCSAIQRQGAKAASGSGVQRVIAMELAAVSDGAVGTLLTPFGLDLGTGVVLTLGHAGPALPFKTCLPTGCVVPLQFGREAMQALRTGSTMQVSFVTAGDGRRIDLAISLDGLGPALDRAKALGGANGGRS